MKYPLTMLTDKKSDCVSIMATLKLTDYIALAEGAYADQGGLRGQRAPIRTKTGLKIRSRLVDDLKQGAVIPPIVVGGVLSSRTLSELKKCQNSDDFARELGRRNIELSIIDGMQRTTALIEAREEAGIDPLVRVEFWLARKVDSLIYRMLVLNTGQVPWDLKRQLETLYRPIIEKVNSEVKNIRVIGLDESNRRSQAGEYRSTRVIELFLAFTSRSIDVDVREKVAEEFARIDITEATAHKDFFPLFIGTIRLLADIDAQFGRLGKSLDIDDDSRAKVKSGRDIFTSAPASIGFVVAVAENLFGTPGFDYDLAHAKKEMELIKANVQKLCRHMGTLDEEELAEFMDLSTLNQMLAVKSSKIGEYERGLYKRAFLLFLGKTEKVIIQGKMSPCWMAK